jgi:oligopeptide transport system substrate-binding protein
MFNCAVSAMGLPTYLNLDNDPLDRLLRDAGKTINTARRAKLMNQAEQRLLDEYSIAPLYFFVSKHLVSPAVRNFEANILDSHPSRFLVKGDGNDG